MLPVVLSKRFRKDLKRAQKRGLDLDLLDAVVNQIAQRKTLDQRYRDHELTGQYAGFRECHVKPDWLLIYRVEEDEVFLLLSRTGTHSDVCCRFWKALFV